MLPLFTQQMQEQYGLRPSQRCVTHAAAACAQGGHEAKTRFSHHPAAIYAAAQAAVVERRESRDKIGTSSLSKRERIATHTGSEARLTRYPKEKKREVCKFWLANRCKNGERCRFQHVMLTPLQNIECNVEHSNGNAVSSRAVIANPNCSLEEYRAAMKAQSRFGTSSDDCGPKNEDKLVDKVERQSSLENIIRSGKQQNDAHKMSSASLAYADIITTHSRLVNVVKERFGSTFRLVRQRKSNLKLTSPAIDYILVASAGTKNKEIISTTTMTEILSTFQKGFQDNPCSSEIGQGDSADTNKEWETQIVFKDYKGPGGSCIDVQANLYCEQRDVGRIIGREGKMIGALENQAGCTISIDQSKAIPKVNIRGSVEAVRAGHILVKRLLDKIQKDRFGSNMAESGIDSNSSHRSGILFMKGIVLISDSGALNLSSSKVLRCLSKGALRIFHAKLENIRPHSLTQEEKKPIGEMRRDAPKYAFPILEIFDKTTRIRARVTYLHELPLTNEDTALNKYSQLLERDILNTVHSYSYSKCQPVYEGVAPAAGSTDSTPGENSVEEAAALATALGLSNSVDSIAAVQALMGSGLVTAPLSILETNEGKQHFEKGEPIINNSRTSSPSIELIAKMSAALPEIKIDFADESNGLLPHHRYNHLPTKDAFPTRNLHVSNFGTNIDEAGILALFSVFCEVKRVIMKQVLPDNTSPEGKNRYCFVWTPSVTTAEIAKNALNGISLDGHRVQVSFAKEKKSTVGNSRLEKDFTQVIRGHFSSGSTVYPPEESYDCDKIQNSPTDGCIFRNKVQGHHRTSSTMFNDNRTGELTKAALAAAAAALPQKVASLLIDSKSGALVADLDGTNSGMAAAAAAAAIAAAAAAVQHPEVTYPEWADDRSTEYHNPHFKITRSDAQERSRIRRDNGGCASLSKLTRNLFVSNFSQETTERDIYELFRAKCNVKRVVMKHQPGSHPAEPGARYCFVWTTEVGEAAKAKNALDGEFFKGTFLQVSFARGETREYGGGREKISRHSQGNRRYSDYPRFEPQGPRVGDYHHSRREDAQPRGSGGSHRYESGNNREHKIYYDEDILQHESHHQLSKNRNGSTRFQIKEHHCRAIMAKNQEQDQVFLDNSGTNASGIKDEYDASYRGYNYNSGYQSGRTAFRQRDEGWF